MLYQLSTKYACGIDLHAKTLTACTMELSGNIIKRKTLPCQIQPVLDFLNPWAPDITVGVESTYNWYWLIDALKDNQIPCVLGHALYIKRKMSSKHKSDPVDARGIADILRTNQFPIAFDYPSAMRAVRDQLRRRHFFVRQRAGICTHFQITLHQEGCIEPLRMKLQNKSTRDSLLELTSNSDVKKTLTTDLGYINSLDTIIDDLEKTLVQKAQYHNLKHFESLQTMPGCGKITALTILYETHKIDRFRSPQCYSSYCRVVRADNSSAGKFYGRTSNDKIGNPYLKWAISEIGQSMIQHNLRVKEWHQKQSALHGKGGAHARLRHKIAVAIYHMLKHDTVFDLDKFLNTNKSRVENPAQSGTETSGQKSDPIVHTENLSGSLKNQVKSKPVKSSGGRPSLLPTDARKVLT
jgi:transposase